VGGPGGSVGISTGYGLDGPGIESRWGARFFAHVQSGPGAHPASCTVGTGSFPGVKWPGRGAEHRGNERVELYLHPHRPVKACNGSAFSVHVSSVTCLFSGGTTQTTLGVLRECYVSWL
jgi:hypothetical protein